MPSFSGNEDRRDLTHHTPRKTKAVIQGLKRNARYVLRVQLVDATQALNLSAGVSYSNVFLGRSLSWRATALSLLWV